MTLNITSHTCPNCGKNYRSANGGLCNPCFVHGITSKVLNDFGWKA